MEVLLRNRRAFTLIELMIVVAAFAIISAILIPAFIRARQASMARVSPIREPQAEAGEVTPSIPQSSTAELRALQLDVTLVSRVQRSGVEVATPYQAKVVGKFAWGAAVRPGDPRLEQVFIPFPLQGAVVSDVHCRLRLGGQPLSEQQVESGPQGLLWKGTIPPDQELEAEFEFACTGQNILSLPLSSNARMRQFRVQVNRKDSPLAEVPSSALQPTKVSPEELLWDYKNLVSQRTLVVELPTSTTDEARILLLSRLVGLAVLLYGLGFWYLGELHQPGRLARFNWANFFLLALTYSFFFPALAVLSLGLGWSLLASIGGAAALSLPLLTLHVSRIVDWHFALSNLLLAGLTLLLVVSGVFGGELRLPVYLASAFLCVGFVTLTYARWSANRELWRRQGEEEWLEGLQVLQTQQLQAREMVAQAQARPANSGERENIEKTCQALLDTLRRCDDTYSRAVSLSQLPWDGNRHETFSLLRESAQQQAASLATSLALLERQMQRQTVQQPQLESNCHCLACGQASQPSRCCPHCGEVRPLLLRCRCGQSLLWPLTYLTKPMVPHCPHCGGTHTIP